MSRPPPALVILAAGLGSRYGGLKQFDAIGPGGERLLEYGVFDARRAGFGRVVLVIRRDLDPVLLGEMRRRFKGKIDLDWVVQDLHDLPSGFKVPAGRSKPWGTLHAVLAARHAVDTPFVVINGDDFYGPRAYREVADFFAQGEGEAGDGPNYCMVGYELCRTVSAHGGVNRGICVCRDGDLRLVEEHTDIVADGDGSYLGCGLDGVRVTLPGDALTSMNFWGFTPAIFEPMQDHFAEFLSAAADQPGAECYVPSMVDRLVRTGRAHCRVLTTPDPWMGVTYEGDRRQITQALQALVHAGVYPTALW